MIKIKVLGIAIAAQFTFRAFWQCDQTARNSNAVATMSEARDYQIEWSFDGVTGDGYLPSIFSVSTLA